MAKLTKDLFGAANGEVYPRTYAAGEECPPELEDAAREIDGLEADPPADEDAKPEDVPPPPPAMPRESIPEGVHAIPVAEEPKPAKPGKA